MAKDNPRRSNSHIRNAQRDYWKSRGLPCGICGQPIDYTLGMYVDPVTNKRRMHPMAFVIDEIVPVSKWREGGYSSPEACAQDISNQRPAHYICNARRGDGTRSGALHVVIGAPCSGKTTFVNSNRAVGDIVIDLDAIAKALGSGVDHGASGMFLKVAQAARRAAIDEVMYRHASAWIIHTQPDELQMAEYKRHGALFHIIDPGAETCMQRAKSNGRPDGTGQAIKDWYATRPSYEGVSSSTAGARSADVKQPFDDW